MTRKKLLVTASVVALGFAVASTASANPKNKFSDAGFAQVNVNVTATTHVSGSNTIRIESGNVEKEAFATNFLTATFDHGTIYTGNGAAAADASAKASADASAKASADASAAAAATSDASAAATAAASSNNAGDSNLHVSQNGDPAAAAAAAAAAATEAAAAADAAADATAAADAAADASASADADAARAGDLLNAQVLLSGSAMLRAAGAFAANLGSAQFTNLNAGNAIAAKTGNIHFDPGANGGVVAGGGT